MEARSRRVGGGFPGYNGPALPRAMRSSRGRGQSATRTSRYGGHSGFFELLATVAGQILQEDSAGEEQDLVRLAEPSGGKVRQKCTDSNAHNSNKDSESSPVRAAIIEQQQVQPDEAASSAHTSCLESLGEAIRDDEARNNLLLSSKKKENEDEEDEEDEDDEEDEEDEEEEEGEEDIGADSVHSVVNKPVLSRPLVANEECPPRSSIPQDTTVNNEKLHLESGGSDRAIPTLQQQPQTEKQQMTSSVSDNDENHTIKSDPDSSTSTAIVINKKHKLAEEFDKMPVVGDTDEAEEDSVQTPKAEEAGGININKAKTATASATPTASISIVGGMEIEQNQQQQGASSMKDIVVPTKAAAAASSIIPNKHGFDCPPVQDLPLSSTITDVAKAELSSEEVMHPPHDDHLQLKKQQDKAVNVMNLAGTKKGGGGMDKIIHGSSSAGSGGVKPWKKSNAGGFYEKDDEGESGLEIDDKSQLDAKKLLKDVILGKLEKKGEAGSALLSEFILGNARERKNSSKRNSICGSPKAMFPVPSKMSSKPTVKDSSYAKGMRARKVVKMVKRSRVSSSRSKRKHADMDAAGDSDEGLPKKPYYSGLSYTRQRTSRGFPAKRKKMVDNSSTGGGGGGPDLHVNTSNLMDLGFEYVEGEPPAAAAKLRSAKAASVASSPTARGCSAKLSKKSGEPHVKLAIKSFTVPELSVDLPESATVLSLKRAVMDAAMNLLGGGLRVRVLLQGKKVPDEGATLAQVGISRAAKPDTLGFMLEPSPSSPTSTSEDPLLVLSRAAGQPSPRYPLFGAPAVPPGGELGSRCPKTRSSKTSGGAGAGGGGAVDGDVTAAPYGAAATPLSGGGDRDRVVEGKRTSAGGLGFPVTAQHDDVAIESTGCAGNHNHNINLNKHHHQQQQQPPKSGSGSGLGGGNLNEQRMSSLSLHSTRVAAVGALAAIRAQADAARRASKNEAIEAAAAAAGGGLGVGGVPVSHHHPHSHSNSHAITAAAVAAHDSSSLVPASGGAIILHPGGAGAMTAAGGEGIQGLALVPVRQKSHPLDVGKRRVRRPFSVAEVEALVHAVEKLGTGRWRDVKLRAFDQAKHRTYVDLKDKWKTLVHTARIAPHQRRGEPVPQELLERVTRAHSYWTAHAAKQQAELDY